MILKHKVKLSLFVLFALAAVAIIPIAMAQASPDAVTPAEDISDGGATAEEQAIAKLGSLPREVRKSDYFEGSIEVLDINLIPDGVEALVRAWDADGEQIGFGPDGSVDVERFRIFNPPVLVPDPSGPVVRKYADPLTNKKRTERFREDPREALLQSLEHAISVKKEKQDSDEIVFGKVGNTTSMFYPAEGSASPVDGYVGQNGPGNAWSGIRDGAGSEVDDVSATALQGIWGGSNNGHIGRYIFLFDTNAIPDEATITAASLLLYVTTKEEEYPDAYSYFNVVRPAVASTSSLSSGDYDSFEGLSGNMTTGSTGKDISTDVVLGAYNEWELDATGLSWISKTAVTELGLAEGHDIENTPPGSGLLDNNENWITVRMADFVDTTEDPTLVVEHNIISSAPTAPTDLFTEGQTNPPVGVTDLTPEFSAIYNDPDAGDSALNYQIQIDDDSNFSSIYWDSGKTSMATTSVGARSPDISYSGSMLAESVIYYWRIKFWDSADQEGEWSDWDDSPSTFFLSFPEILKARKLTDQSDNNATTTIEDDNELVLFLSANTTFIIDGVLFTVATNGTPDIHIGFAGPVGSDLTLGYTNDVSESVLDLGETSPRIQLMGNTDTSVHLHGTITTGSIAGSFRLQWSQATANTNNPTTVQAGSYLRAEEI